MIIKPKQMSESVEQYKKTFGHPPSPEALKFQTEKEISSLAEMALVRKKPVKDWAERPSVKTGTILDNLYN
jgi:hypothetical protein